MKSARPISFITNSAPDFLCHMSFSATGATSAGAAGAPKRRAPRARLGWSARIAERANIGRIRKGRTHARLTVRAPQKGLRTGL